MNVLGEVGVVFGYELKRTLRSAKVIVLLVLCALAAGTASLILMLMTRQAALLLPFFSKFSLFFLPVLVTLMCFDQLSAELQVRSLRYVASRGSREAVVLGKALAQMAVLFGLTAVVNLVLFGFTASQTPAFDYSAGALQLARFWVVLLVYGATWVGLAFVFSGLFRTPILALLVTLCALFGFWLVDVLGNVWPALHFLAYVSPSHYDAGLSAATFEDTLPSIGAYLAFAVGFLGLAVGVLRARDL